MRYAGSLALALTLSCVGCGEDGDRTLTVLAAASLTSTFSDLAEEFEAAHEGVEVRLVLDSSATLARMAADGAPGDVLATADRRTMDEARDAGGTRGLPVEFASNVIVLVVPRDNPADIDVLSDLDRAGVDYLTCVPTAPCGAAARSLLDRNGIDREPVSQEVDVRAVLGKVGAGEADAGLVYRTDVTAAAGSVRGIPVPGAEEEPNTYWVAVTAEAEQKDLARDWVELLTGADGKAVLRTAGFGTG